MLYGEYITTIAKIVIAITSKNIILLIPFIIEGNNILRIKTTPKATINFKAINYYLSLIKVNFIITDIIFCKNLSKNTKLNFKPAKNKFESIAAHDSLVNFSASLNNLAVSLLKIGNDLRMLSSGPRAGLNELILPVNEPGSSIMPGKVNPTHIEALTMVCTQVMGNHVTISMAGSQGHFELNAFKTVIIYNLIQSIYLLADSINYFNNKCLKKIKPNKRIMKKNLDNSLMIVKR